MLYSSMIEKVARYGDYDRVTITHVIDIDSQTIEQLDEKQSVEVPRRYKITSGGGANFLVEKFNRIKSADFASRAKQLKSRTKAYRKFCEWLDAGCPLSDQPSEKGIDWVAFRVGGKLLHENHSLVRQANDIVIADRSDDDLQCKVTGSKGGTRLHNDVNIRGKSLTLFSSNQPSTPAYGEPLGIDTLLSMRFSSGITTLANSELYSIKTSTKGAASALMFFTDNEESQPFLAAMMGAKTKLDLESVDAWANENLESDQLVNLVSVEQVDVKNAAINTHLPVSMANVIKRWHKCQKGRDDRIYGISMMGLRVASSGKQKWEFIPRANKQICDSLALGAKRCRNAMAAYKRQVEPTCFADRMPVDSGLESRASFVFAYSSWALQMEPKPGDSVSFANEPRKRLLVLRSRLHREKNVRSESVRNRAIGYLNEMLGNDEFRLLGSFDPVIAEQQRAKFEGKQGTALTKRMQAVRSEIEKKFSQILERLESQSEFVWHYEPVRLSVPTESLQMSHPQYTPENDKVGSFIVPDFVLYFPASRQHVYIEVVGGANDAKAYNARHEWKLKVYDALGVHVECIEARKDRGVEPHQHTQLFYERLTEIVSERNL